MGRDQIGCGLALQFRVEDLKMNIDGDALKFINSPPEYMHLKCPVCFKLLLDPPPELVGCCGNHFCSACIESLKDKPCPLCKSTNFQHMQDKNLSRGIKALKVYCTNQPSCTWEGSIEELVYHLSAKCQYVQLPCKHQCGASVQRSELIEHEDKKCIKRPLVCEHCHEYSSTWEDVTTVHYDTCDQVPVECPNKCGDTVPRGPVDEHQTTVCPLEIVECEMASFFCLWKGERKDVDDHMKQERKEHVLLMMSSHTKSMEELSMKIEQKDTEIQDLKQELFDLKSRVGKLEDKGIEQEELQLRSRSKVVGRSMSSKMLYLGLNFYVNDFDSKQKLNNSATFWLFLGENGYRMQLLVFPNGKEKSRGSYLSVYFRFAYGSNDDNLIWPFRGSITINIGNVTVTIRTESYPDKCFAQPSDWGEYNEKWGIENFMSHSVVDKFLVKNSLLVKVVSASIPVFV